MAGAARRRSDTIPAAGSAAGDVEEDGHLMVEESVLTLTVTVTVKVTVCLRSRWWRLGEIR